MMLNPLRDRTLLLLTLEEIIELCSLRGLEIQNNEHGPDPIVHAIFSAAQAAIGGRVIHVGKGDENGLEAERVPGDGASIPDTRPINIRSRRPIEEEQGAGEQRPLPGEGEERIPNAGGDVLPSGEDTSADGEGGEGTRPSETNMDS